MSLTVLRYIDNKGGKANIEEIDLMKAKLDSGLHFYANHTVNEALTDLYRDGLIFGPGPGAVIGEVKLTPKGKEVAAILKKPDELHKKLIESTVRGQNTY
jgi:hypothetical protein